MTTGATSGAAKISKGLLGWGLLLFLSALASGCAGAPVWLGGGGRPPQVTLERVAIASQPEHALVEAYLCPSRLRAEGRVSTAADAMCLQLFGQVPPATAISVVVDVTLRVRNPNRSPMPLSALAAAVSVFPGQPTQKVGAACLPLCTTGSARCPRTDSRACLALASETAPAWLNHPRMTPRLLAGRDPQAPQGALTAGRVVPGRGQLLLTFQVALNPEEVFPLVAAQPGASSAPVSIPYRIEGAVAAKSGRGGDNVSTPFGPIGGTWLLSSRSP